MTMAIVGFAKINTKHCRTEKAARSMDKAVQ